MSIQTRNYEVVVVGGGMVGLCQAVACARAGVRVAVVEKGALPEQLEASFDGRVSAVALGSARLLEAIGVWEGMRERAQAILDIRVSDGDTPFFLHFEHGDISGEPFGFIVENRYIRHALQEAARGLPNLTLIERESVAGFAADAGGVTLRLESGRELRCGLLVGADGKHSAIRGMAGIGVVESAYAQTAIVCTIAHELPHHGLAQERFLPAGPFAVLPMQGNRSSLVWVEPKERAGMYLGLPEAECVQEIMERVGGYLGEIRPAGPRFAYPLSLMHAKDYTAPRLALIGDAAHAIHPIAGQGVNLGFRDAGALTGLIAGRLRLGLDIGGAEMLAEYQRLRRFDNVAMLAATDGLNRLFTNAIPPVRLARGLGLWGVGKLPPLKRFFMRHAMGV